MVREEFPKRFMHEARRLYRWAAAVPAATAMVLAVQPAQAGPNLIGDTISFMRVYPDRNTSFGTAIADSTVVAGSADTVFWGAGGYVLTGINPEANSVEFDLYTTTQYIGTPTVFDGYIVSGIDFDLASVSLLSNSSLLAVENLSFDAHGFSFSLSGVTRPGVLVFSVIAKDGVASVPEPKSIALAFIGLCGLGIQRYRSRSAQRF